MATVGAASLRKEFEAVMARVAALHSEGRLPGRSMPRSAPLSRFRNSRSTSCRKERPAVSVAIPASRRRRCKGRGGGRGRDAGRFPDCTPGPL